MSFSTSDLRLSQTDLDKITRTLSNLGATDPVGAEISERTQQVADYTARYDISDDRANRLIGPLVIGGLYMRLPGGEIPPNIKAGFDAAMKELADIRDGKFADLIRLNPAPVNIDQTGGGRFGSRKRRGW